MFTPRKSFCFASTAAVGNALYRTHSTLCSHALPNRPSTFVSRSCGILTAREQSRSSKLRACADKDTESSSEFPRRPKAPEQTFFGLRLRTNGDVLKFGVVATIIPFGIKALIQTALVQFWPSNPSNPDLLAGQLTTAFISIFALLAWVSTYVFRVGTKQMTYAQQLRDYEDQVIQKRYEELTEEELAALTDELNDEAQ